MIMIPVAMIMDDFLIRAALAGVGLSLATGPLGSFVVWRRMAYFGDTVAHGAILGVALSLAFSISIMIGTLAVALAIGILASSLHGRGRAMDTTLGVLAHATLALGLILVSFLHGVRIDLETLLFGDILTVSVADVWLIWGGSLLVLALLVWRWNRLLSTTLSEELAITSGINPQREGLVLTFALALVVALALKVVGALLIGALLIIPAAAARGGARNPEAMAAIATGIGALASISGIALSAYADTPAGPGIVVSAAFVFVLSLIWSRYRHID